LRLPPRLRIVVLLMNFCSPLGIGISHSNHCIGRGIRLEWLGKIPEVGVRRRAELFYQQLDALQALRQQASRELLVERRKHSATKLPRQIPCIGLIWAALLIALIQTPYRFRTKRQLWAYIHFGIEMHSSAEYNYVEGQLRHSTKPVMLRGPNRRQAFISSGRTFARTFPVSKEVE